MRFRRHAKHYLTMARPCMPSTLVRLKNWFQRIDRRQNRSDELTSQCASHPVISSGAYADGDDDGKRPIEQQNMMVVLKRIVHVEAKVTKKSNNNSSS